MTEYKGDEIASEDLVKTVMTINSFQAFLDEMRKHVDSEQMLLTGMTHSFVSLLTKVYGPKGATEFLEQLARENKQFEISQLN